MTEERYLSLCEKYLNGTCSLQEELLIKEYQQAHGIENSQWDDELMGDQERIKMMLEERLQESMAPPKSRTIRINTWWYAAAAILLFTTAIYFLPGKNAQQANIAANAVKKPVNDIQPGSNKAILTLATGKSIVLDSAGNGVLSRQGGSTISRSGNGLTVNADHQKLTPEAAIALNNITIPRGGKYDITLPDGTKVWLNSSSSLTFPTAFTGTERKVTLVGEAYFEVAKNKNMPFKINVNDKQIVEVLGTHFNISAYTDERAITTTLLEGSVKINYKNRSTLIVPGQMAVNNLTSNIEVKPADVDEIMAWKNGMFMFNDENITGIMKAISRWYDVDLSFKGRMEDINFTGNYSRNKSLSSLLKNIERMDKVRFVVEGRRITVISK